MKEQHNSRLIRQFIELVTIDSPSGEERAVADYLKKELGELGMDVAEDGAGEKLGTDCGNLIARLEGNQAAPAILLAAHMDTVVPGRGIRPLLREGAIYSSGDTILGADDKAGIAVILEVMRRIREERISHGRIEVLFSVGEEQGLLGAKQLDFSRLSAEMGFVLDSSGEIGSFVVQGPVQNQIEATVSGRAAHAGINPEDGINAIQVAARAIANMRLGRIDEETTTNIGVINGGEARNIVPERVYIKGEARSLKTDKLDAVTQQMVKELEREAEAAGAAVEVRVERLYPAFCLSEDQAVVKVTEEAVRRVGLVPRREKSGGGSDANIINGMGIPTVNLGVAMRQVHTREEHIFLHDLEKLAALVLEICRVAAGENAGSGTS
ncbi:MAG: M20/M25/M40 family metallo-hydrolase [Syntrophomonadaceae bacterium]|nr:M20/M25/M40 family metallo-hydrolase [Syntrophomonadaceae bacterium]